MELCFCILQLQQDYYLHKSGFNFTQSGGIDGEDFVEMAIWMVLIRDRMLFKFKGDWKPFIDFLHVFFFKKCSYVFFKKITFILKK